jgi:hypothetical protein
MWPQMICDHQQDDKNSERYHNDDDCLQRVFRNRHVAVNLKRNFALVDKTFSKCDSPTVSDQLSLIYNSLVEN